MLANLFSKTNTNALDFIDTQNPSQNWEDVGYLNFAGVSVKVRCACNIASKYFSTFTDHAALYTNKSLKVDVMRSSYGYVLISGTQIISGSLKLSQLLDRCIKLITQECLASDDIALIEGSVISYGEKNIMIIGNREQLDSFAYEFCKDHTDAKILSGSPIITTHKNSVRCTDLPLLLPSNTDTISSSYDPSNYYPQKPNTTNSAHVPIVKRDWIISETSTQPCWLAPANGEFGDCTEISVMLFIEPNSDGERDASINAITSAQTIEKIWVNSVIKKSTSSENLPNWVTGLTAYSLSSKDLKQAKLKFADVCEL